MSDYVLRYDQTVNCNISRVDVLPRVNDSARRLVAAATAGMRDEGFADDQISVVRSGDVQYAGQVHALPIELPDADLVPDGLADVLERFTRVYEATYGTGTALSGMRERLVNYTITATGSMPSPRLEPMRPSPRSLEEMLKGRREVYLPVERERRSTPIYEEARFSVGSIIPGPA